MTRILGVDFSGAQDAGRKIWIAEGQRTNGPFEISDCRPAINLHGGGQSPAVAIAALARHILIEPDTIVGCDFPFSLPIELVQTKNWAEFALLFKKRFITPESFHDLCHQETAGIEIKRRTDREDKTPFNSFNLRLYRQTWWGISHLLAPLIASKAIYVWPQMSPIAGKPIVIEICAACSLIKLDCYPSYKGRTRKHYSARKRILDMMIEKRFLAPPNRELRSLLLKNQGGDALDSVIGAIAVNRSNLNTKRDHLDRLEGRVFFDIS